ncbi:hypothetical protein SRIMM317S_02094 [Streptomyces rimosus subsp. rimosus]
MKVARSSGWGRACAMESMVHGSLDMSASRGRYHRDIGESSGAGLPSAGHPPRQSRDHRDQPGYRPVLPL